MSDSELISHRPVSMKNPTHMLSLHRDTRPPAQRFCIAPGLLVHKESAIWLCATNAMHA